MPHLVQDSVTLNPPAKINLSLVVLKRREDGYHSVHTVMAAISLHDSLTLKVAGEPGIHFSCSGLSCPGGSENLVCRAAKIFTEHTQEKRGLEIHLEKQIPLAAGLGGGSSDAAACLLGLNHLLKAGLTEWELEQMAGKLGSDVPFFLRSPVAVCTGRGHLVRTVPYRCDYQLLLIFPQVAASTAAVYQNYQYDPVTAKEELRQVRHYLEREDLNGLIAQGINDLKPASMNLYKPLADLSAKLEQMGIGPVYMTGSGSTLFLISKSSDQIQSWAHSIRQHNLAIVQEARFLDRSGLFTGPYPEGP